jgi:hypothetical protein
MSLSYSLYALKRQSANYFYDLVSQLDNPLVSKTVLKNALIVKPKLFLTLLLSIVEGKTQFVCITIVFHSKMQYTI